MAGLLFLACWFAMAFAAAGFVAWLSQRVRRQHIRRSIHRIEHYANHPDARTRHHDQDRKEKP